MPFFNENELHIIERKDLDILFFKKDLTFMPISKEVKEKIQTNVIDESLIDNDPTTELEPYLNGGKLDILLLNISNNCNLNCTYCYNQGGTYQDRPSLMTEEVALQAVDLIFQHYEKVESVQFFGGEPLLNYSLIEVVCKYIEEKIEAGSEMLPSFGLNTNGTILNDEILDIIKKYKINVSISIDGCEEVHNLARINSSGHGSYQKVIENIKRMREITEMPNCIEAAFSQYHIRKGRRVIDIVDHIRDGLGLDATMSISPIASALENYPLTTENLDSFIELIRREFNRLREGKRPNLTLNMKVYLKRLFQHKTQKLLCLAGFYKLAVNASGYIYPCNGLVNQDGMLIGHVSNSPEEFAWKLREKQDYLATLRKTTFFTDCQTCWMYNLCAYCMIYSLRDGKLDLNQLNSKFCYYNQKVVEELVVQLARCKQDEYHWKMVEKYLIEEIDNI